MNILITAESYLPIICGVQEVIQNISEGLLSRGHHVTIATSYNAERNSSEFNGVKVEQFQISGKWIKGFIGEIKKYQDYLLDSDYDIILNYAATCWSSDLVFPLLSKIKSLKIFIPCGYSTLYNWKWKPYYWILPSVLRKYDHIIYHCGNYRDKPFGDKYKINHCTVIPNGISAKAFTLDRTGFKTTYGIEQKQMFLCVSNYGEGKNQEFVINAFQKAGIKNSILVLIGSQFNKYSDYLKNTLIGEGEYNPIVLLEKIPREKIISALFDAELFLFGSQIEYFPLVILEAMAAGTPFISTDVGCVKNLPGGLIVNSVEEMAAKINLLISNNKLGEQLSKDGIEAVKKKYEWSIIIDQYEQLFYQLLK
ncbi:MAG: glycosyltransferase family 4 protein [Melioribacteraceae bacterium]|nr:glycosyltransferase family 4 protein [Melioribacteraceae bacterium]